MGGQRIQQFILITPEPMLIGFKRLRVGLKCFLVLVVLRLIHQPRSHCLLGCRNTKVGKQLPHAHSKGFRLIKP